MILNLIPFFDTEFVVRNGCRSTQKWSDLGCLFGGGNEFLYNTEYHGVHIKHFKFRKSNRVVVIRRRKNMKLKLEKGGYGF